MGFLDELRLNNVFNPGAWNKNEPLFGGLIPRREIIEESPRIVNIPQEIRTPNVPSMQQGTMRGVASPFHTLGLDKQDSGGNRIINAGPNVDLERLALDRNKEEFSQQEKSQRLRLDTQKASDKSDINHRRLALDQWKAANPEGEIKVDQKTGKVMVINKQTGTSIDTGLTGEHLSKEDEIKLGITGRLTEEEFRQKGAKELETQRQSGRLELEANKPGSAINPSQQRIAEDDSANELLKDPRYSWLADKGLITFDKATGVNIKQAEPSNWPGSATAKQIEDTNKKIEEFKNEWKQKAHERMNVTRDKNVSSKEDTSSNGKIIIIAPDGTEGYWPADKEIPKDYKKKG